MRIEIWSDVVCPWCYVGKRRLETALAAFAHRDEVEVVYRSFELDPSAPQHGHERTVESLARKYGRGEDEMRQMQRVDRDRGRGGPGVPALRHRAHQHRRRPPAAPPRPRDRRARSSASSRRRCSRRTSSAREYVGDHDVLRRRRSASASTRPGSTRCSRATSTPTRSHADIAQARAYGATGVPFFVVDQRYGVSGAQPAEVFSQVLEQAWTESHPGLQMVGAPGAEACGPDGCAI